MKIHSPSLSRKPWSLALARSPLSKRISNRVAAALARRGGGVNRILLRTILPRWFVHGVFEGSVGWNNYLTDQN